MTLEELKERKRILGLTNEQIALQSGVPIGTVQKVFGGATASPRYKTLKALEKVLAPSVPSAPAVQAFSGEEISVREADAVYGAKQETFGEKKQGEFTVRDYLDYPEDQRIELIDGVIYDMAAPTAWHQIAAGLIYHQLLNYISRKKGSCLPFISPIDVQLDRDDKTMVQPDVIILCDKKKLLKGRVFGAPDFVAEVLSPSTRIKDMMIKLPKYQAAGVREFWIVDLKRKTVIVYTFEEGDIGINLYGFTDRVPVAVYQGECGVDFTEILDMLGEIDTEGME